MRNQVIIPLGAGGSYDDLRATIGTPPYIVAEKKLVTFYSATGSVTAGTIGAAWCPARTDYDRLDADSKSVGTYQKSERLQFQKYPLPVITGSPAVSPDSAGVFSPTFVYNQKEKKFMVYYIGMQAGPIYTICLAAGYEPNALVKQGVAGDGAIINTWPGPGTFSPLFPFQVVYDKEENLYKLFYVIGFPGPVFFTYVSTSKNGYDW